MSVNLEAMLEKPVQCVTALGDVYTGTLNAVDGAFNVVIADCARNGQPQGEPRTFIRAVGPSVQEQMALPGVARYERIPTRTKIQFFWISMLMMGFVYQFLKMTVLRIQPKREEQMYMHLQKLYGDNIPDELVNIAKRQREAQDALSLTNMLRTPTPGSTSNALQNELDPRAISRLRSWNGY